MITHETQYDIIFIIMKGIYISIIAVAIIIITGFIFVFDSISALKSDVNNIELALEFKNGSENQDIKATGTEAIIIAEDNRDTATSTNPKDYGIEIPTGIIFSAKSSAALLPQTTLTVTIESIIKYDDGNIAVNFKVFANEASGYVAFEPKYEFQLINPSDGLEQKAFKVTGTFDAIPPKGVSSGTLMFQGFSERRSVILQTNSGENTKFFEIDFADRTYKETVLG